MSKKVDFLYLSESDMMKAGVLDMGRCMASMEEMFRLLQREDYRMGGQGNEHGMRVLFPKSSEVEGMPLHEPDRRFMIMPAYLGGRFRKFGIKSYGSNPRNKEEGLPRSILMMSLLDVDTGIPMAYMSANLLSAMRTAAVSGVAARHLSREGTETLAVIGPGAMARYAMMAFLEVRPQITTVKIKGRSQKGIRHFIEFCKEHFPQIQHYQVCSEIQEACEESDIIYFGTTNAQVYEENPQIKEEWIKKGALVISVSALLTEAKLLASPNVKLVADHYRMYEDWGEGRQRPVQKHVSTLLGMGFYDAVCEGAIQREKIVDMGEILNGQAHGRDNDEEIIFFAEGGLPVEDVAWACDCYDAAREMQIGTPLNLWDIPAMQ